MLCDTTHSFTIAHMKPISLKSGLCGSTYDVSAVFQEQIGTILHFVGLGML